MISSKTSSATGLSGASLLGSLTVLGNPQTSGLGHIFYFPISALQGLVKVQSDNRYSVKHTEVPSMAQLFSTGTAAHWQSGLVVQELSFGLVTSCFSNVSWFAVFDHVPYRLWESCQ